MANLETDPVLLELHQLMASRCDPELSATLRKAVERIETLAAMLRHAEMIGDDLSRVTEKSDRERKGVADSFKEVATLQAVPPGHTRHDGPFMLPNHWMRLKTLEPGTKLYVCAD